MSWSYAILVAIEVSLARSFIFYSFICFFIDLSLLMSGGMDPRCKICIFMGKTDPDAPKHKQQVKVAIPSFKLKKQKKNKNKSKKNKTMTKKIWKCSAVNFIFCREFLSFSLVHTGSWDRPMVKCMSFSTLFLSIICCAKSYLLERFSSKSRK